jgi:hypothetical protein
MLPCRLSPRHRILTIPLSGELGDEQTFGDKKALTKTSI